MRIFLDANVVIFAVERSPVWGPLAAARLATARAVGDRFALTDLVRMECLVGPLRAGDPVGVADFARFCAAPDVDVLPVTPALCERAAQVRAAHNFLAMDALHLAAAVEHGCDLILTNDTRWTAFPDVAVEILH